jgi:BolA protein
METQQRIEAGLLAAFSPQRLAVENDSHNHAGARTDSHFSVVIIGEYFSGMSAVDRQRAVYACLADELAGPVHALQMKVMTPEEFSAAGELASLEAPLCKGTKK